VTELPQGTRTGWESEGLTTRYQVIIRDHGTVYEGEVVAVDMQYALATVLIEQHIYLTNADSIEIRPVSDSSE